MTLKCFLSPLAEKDVDEIVTYIAKENPTSAYAFLDALFDTMEKLADCPDMGHYVRI